MPTRVHRLLTLELAGKVMAYRRCVFLAGIIALVIGPVTVHATTIYVSKSGNDANDGQSWATAKLTVQGGIIATASGDQVWVAAGTYVERIQLRDGVAVYGGFSGSETDLAQRNWTTNVTILDANKTGPVVVTGFASTAATRIDGFTL